MRGAVFLYVAILLVAIGFTLRALIRSYSPSATPGQKLASNRAALIALLLFLLFLTGAALDSGGTSDLEWEILAVIVVGLIVVVPIWALVRTFSLKRTSATHEDIARLAERMFALESRVKELQQAVESFRASGAPLETVAKPPAAPPLPATPPPAAKSIEKPPAAVVTPPVIPPEPQKPAVPSPVFPRTEVLSTPSAAPPIAEEISPPAAPRWGWGDIEEKLGTNWLGKIGITVLVIGLGLLLNYWIPLLGKGGKVAVAYTLSAALLTLGVLGERRERYVNIGRVLLGGGWAATYATTYALHNIHEVRVVESPMVGFLLLFLVAVAMVLHSLRYHSQIVTGLAYMLAFTSVLVSWLDVGGVGVTGKPAAGTLVASALLAASLVVVLSRRKWYGLEPLAIVVTYAVHWVWLNRMFDWIGAHKPFPEFPVSAALLTVYWAIFVVSHFRHGEEEPRQRYLLTASFLLNVAGYLAVMRYQSFYPELRFWFLLGVGIVYLALSLFSRRVERRLSFLLHSTVGAALVLVAIPYRYSGTRLELIWLVEAEALLLVGWRAADAHLRRLGWAGLGVLATYVTFHDISPRLVTWRPPDFAAGWLLLTLAAAYYINARMTPRLLGDSATETDTTAATGSSPIATAFLMAAAWLALPFMWTALVWAALAVVLGEIGRPTDDRILRGCGHGAALLAAIRLLSVNLDYAQPALGTNLRVLTLALTAALFYFAARRIPAARGQAEESYEWLGRMARRGGLPAAYTWAASTLAVLLIWYEATNAAVAVAWALLALALVEIGAAIGDKPLVAQGYAVLALSFIRIFFADLNADGAVGPFTSRLVSVTLLAVIFYFAAWTAGDDWRRMRVALYWFGSTAVLALLRFELPLEWIAVGWAATTALFYWLGRGLRLEHLRYQSYLLAVLVGLRCAFDNFYQKAPMWPRNVRTVTVVIAAVLLYAVLATALIEKRKQLAATPAPAEAGDD